MPEDGTFAELSFDNFEDGWGNWIDGGADAKIYTRGRFATGQNAINLRRDGADATMTTSNLGLAGKTEIKVEFEYIPQGLDATEHFQLQVSTDGGSSFQLVQQWTRNVDFVNREYHAETVTISGFSLTDQTQIRFRNFADSRRDNVYIDEVRVLVK